MVPPKVKVKAAPIPFTEESSKSKKGVGAGKFVIYSDMEKFKPDGTAGRSKSAVGLLMPPRQNSLMVKKAVSQTITSGGTDGLGKKKSLGASDASGKTNIRRKALADVSNVQKSSVLSKAVCDGSKPMKYKSEGFTSLKRASTDSGVRKVGIATRKPLVVGKVMELLNKGTEEHHISNRELNSAVDNQRVANKEQCRDTAIIDKRKTQISYNLARKSLPVLGRNSQDNCRRTNKEKGGSAMPVKMSGHRALPRISNVTSHSASNRASGCTTTCQSTVGASSRRPTKQIFNNAPVASNSRRAAKSKSLTVQDKQSSLGISSKKQTELSVSLVENKSQQDVKGENASNSIVQSGGNTSDSTTKTKAVRRRSYTSLLMARSKLLHEHGEDLKLEKLPTIDDCTNQLEVAEYVDDIYKYYWNIELHSPCLVNYMSIQTDITPHMRGILINWLIEVHFKFELMYETLYLMVTLLDRYLSQVTIKKNEMQLVGLTALLLASKYEDFWHPRITDLISISAESYTREQMLSMEKSILKQLKFRLNVPTPYVFMMRFLKAAHSDRKLENLAFYLIELCLVEYEALQFKPSLLCASAIYVARCTLQMTPAWTPLIVKHARYEVSQIRECAEMILRFQKAARSGQLTVTYEKYMDPELSSVAAITPLDKLPV